MVGPFEPADRVDSFDFCSFDMVLPFKPIGGSFDMVASFDLAWLI